MKRILVISAHPNKQSFSHALAKAYVSGARQSDISVDLVHVGDVKIDVNKTPTRTPTPAIARQQKHVAEASHIVVVTPIWHYSFPGLAKLYFEHVLTPGFAYSYPHPWPLMSNFLPKRNLKGKSVRIISTQDSFRIVSWLVGNPFLFSIPASVFFFVGMFPIRRTVFTRVVFSSASKRQRWLERVERLGVKAR